MAINEPARSRAGVSARARGADALRARGAEDVARRLEALLDQAAAALPRDPDAAALLLDGALLLVVAGWHRRQGHVVPTSDGALAQLARECEPLAWRLRLALRAPDAAARLAQCRRVAALLRALSCGEE